MEKNNTADYEQDYMIGEYCIKRNYGKEDAEECLLKIVRFKISQILQKKENIVT